MLCRIGIMRKLLRLFLFIEKAACTFCEPGNERAFFHPPAARRTKIPVRLRRNEVVSIPRKPKKQPSGELLVNSTSSQSTYLEPGAVELFSSWCDK
eukprot:scaffold34600_cov155-Skeletonema_dohrnii-CCMP3373.AAC.14